nr:MAG: replication initiator protein [Microviridae sp.]
MPCYHPMIAYRSRTGPLKGKWPIVFNVKDGYADKPVTIPCGKCIGCRLERSRQWAVRCVQEASMHKCNSFITLTYANDNVNDNGVTSLVKNDFTLFMKRFRAMLWEHHKARVRFFHCGEYGELLFRPHHHSCIFGWDFPDKVLFSVRDGVRLYRSPFLESLWTFGFSTVGDVTFESAAYVARYVCKKVTGDGADSHYNGRVPEYVTMSRRPGIGKKWLDKFSGDVYTKDMVVVRRGLICKPPKYYDKMYDQFNPIAMRRVKDRRLHEREEVSYEQLAVSERCCKARVVNLIRNIEGV